VQAGQIVGVTKISLHIHLLGWGYCISIVHRERT
jgi:hypothetical protein